MTYYGESTTLAGLELRNVEKTFGPNRVLKGINLTIAPGEFFALLGPSGCGKTTILRIIAGFEQPTSGALYFDDQEITRVAPHHRPVNTVFQSYALFPHLSVFENVGFGLTLRKRPKNEIASRVGDMLELVNLPGYEKRSIPSLSGGEKQRVALARALINRPAILLLDEPLAALDLQLRRKVQFEIKEIHRKIGTTFVYVTHDQEEALAMSDRIAVMVDGQIEQLGTPQSIYDQPDTRFVAKFIGASNLFEGTVKERDSNIAEVEVDGFGAFRAPLRNGSIPGDRVGLILRPEKIEIVHDNGRAQGFAATIEEALYLGAFVQYRLRLGETSLVAVQHVTSHRTPIRPGEKVRIRWAPEDLVVVER